MGRWIGNVFEFQLIFYRISITSAGLNACSFLPMVFICLDWTVSQNSTTPEIIYDSNMYIYITFNCVQNEFNFMGLKFLIVFIWEHFLFRSFQCLLEISVPDRSNLFYLHCPLSFRLTIEGQKCAICVLKFFVRLSDWRPKIACLRSLIECLVCNLIDLHWICCLCCDPKWEGHREKDFVEMRQESYWKRQYFLKHSTLSLVVCLQCYWKELVSTNISRFCAKNRNHLILKKLQIKRLFRWLQFL